MEEDEGHKATVKIETVEIQCKVEIEEQTEIKVERNTDEGDSEPDENSTETPSSHGIKRNKGNESINKKIKIEEASESDTDIEEVHHPDPLDVSDQLDEDDPQTTDETQVLEHFTRWQLEKGFHGYTEDVFLSYFNDLEVRLNPTNLWNSYCTLKLALLARGTVDINRHHKLKYYIRKITDGFREKESRVFTSKDIKTFLKNAPDDTHLAWKVALIIGVIGGCRCDELRNITVDDVKMCGNKALVHIQESSKKLRSYVISENYAFYIKKYLQIRPKNLTMKKLLVPCKYNEFSKQAMGKKKIGSIPSGVARFLNLPHADEYTGHTYRRTFVLCNPLNQSNTFDSDCESDNDNNIDNLDNKKIENHDNRNKKMPTKIYMKFLDVHDIFKRWMKEMRVPYIFEDCVLTYFKELAKNYKPMSLWKLFSMLRYTLLIEDKLDIGSYKDVTDYLNERVEEAKQRTVGAFSARDIDVFVKEAPDDSYLGTKVALILGVSGGCNCQELINLTIDNVTRYGTTIIVKIKDSKKNNTFIIPDNYCEYINKYIDLRPKDLLLDKFLLLLKNGKFTHSSMGTVMVRSVPRDVASYLKIPNADEFTGHYLKRTAFVLFNLTTVSILNDSDNDESESDNHNDNRVENSDNEVEKHDKLKNENKKCTNNNVTNDNRLESADNKVERYDKMNYVNNTCPSNNANNDNRLQNSDNKFEKPDQLKNVNKEYPSNNINNDNRLQNSDNKFEKLDKLKIIDNKCSKQNEIDSKNSKVDNEFNNINSDEDVFEVTPDIIEDESRVDNNSKPGWHPRYDEIYNYFIRWLEGKSTNSLSENIMLIYFKELAEKLKPSTLWSQYYVLKRTLLLKNNIDISDYDDLKDFLKKKTDGFRCTKSRVFTIQQIDDFLEKAPDNVYLHWKVALILGIKGACKCTELLNLTTENIKLQENIITVKVQETRNRKRKFYITDNYYTHVKKYIEMRPPNCKTDRFLLLIKNKKVIKACVGKQTINNMAKEIALYLNLPFPEEYNGHCFKTTSMSLFSHDALVRSNRQAGQLYKAKNEANEAQKVETWPKNDGKRALCWPLTIENNETTEEQWSLNSENGVFEIIDQN